MRVMDIACLSCTSNSALQLGLLSVLVFAPIPGHCDNRALPRVSIESRVSQVGEGEEALFRIARNKVDGAMVVHIRLGGDVDSAEIEFPGHGERTDSRAAVNIANGERFVDLSILALRDDHAEANEELKLTLEPSRDYALLDAGTTATVTVKGGGLLVNTIGDAGEGSLRQAILNASLVDQAATIRFDSTVFAEPGEIALAAPLPPLAGQLTIDGRIEDRLWKATGVTVSGRLAHRVFEVTPSGRVTLRALTVAAGWADEGGGVLNSGQLHLDAVTVLGNAASVRGAGVLNLGGTLIVSNATFAHNVAGSTGGGLANARGSVRIVHATFARNRAARGAGLFNEATLGVHNTIIADSELGEDCVSVAPANFTGSHNLIETNQGCGEAQTRDPALESLGYFNGPTKTFALNARSAAINSGDNTYAVDQSGESMQWDQRGNGDPRIVAGFADIGAFEYQRLPELVVDTAEDIVARGCLRTAPEDCSLRGAIELANANPELNQIRFDTGVLSVGQVIVLTASLPAPVRDIVLDAGQLAPITLSATGNHSLFEHLVCVNVNFDGVKVEQPLMDSTEGQTHTCPQ